MTGQRYAGDALGYWRGTVESGELDSKELWDDDTPMASVALSESDLEIIEEALKRRFVSKKSNRTGVLHATLAIRQAQL